MQFIAVDMKLVREANLEGNEIKILLIIQSFIPNPFPSTARICQISGLCKNTVLKYMRSLERKKILKRHERAGHTNFYELNPTLLLEGVKKKMKDAVYKYVTVFRELLAKKKVLRDPPQTMGKHTPNNPPQTSSPYLEQENISIGSLAFSLLGTLKPGTPLEGALAI